MKKLFTFLCELVLLITTHIPPTQNSKPTPGGENLV